MLSTGVSTIVTSTSVETPPNEAVILYVFPTVQAFS